MRQIYIDSTPPENVVIENVIKKLSFYSASSGYAAFSRYIGFTSDSGHTFTRKDITLANVDYNGYYNVNLTFGFGISGVKAFDQNNVIVYGNYGFIPAILYSFNGCNSFKLIFLSQFDLGKIQFTNGVEDMVFPGNGNIGYAVDADRILKTTNKGLSWFTVRNDPDAYFKDLDAIDANTVFTYSAFTYGPSNGTKLLQTTNAGSSWQLLAPPGTPATDLILNVEFISPVKGWINTIDGQGGDKLFYTADAGVHWVQKNNTAGTPFIFSGMKFINDSTGLALAGSFEVLKTTDSGKIWEPVLRDNNFTYLGYSFNDLQVFNATQLWAGGGRGFLEISTNAGGPTLPVARFGIDTLNVWQTNKVNLINYSKPGYQYAWYVNKTLVSNAYNISYTHVLSRALDTIQLIVTKGAVSDTFIQQQYFIVPNLPFMASFTPNTGSNGTLMTITGTGLANVNSVSIGGTAVASFTIVSDKLITAIVANGTTGAVQVTDIHGSYSLPGFTYYPPPSAPAPVIGSVSPESGPIGTTVTITGNNFNASAAGNVVFFGATKATISSASATQIVCAVPAGASFERITVLNAANGLMGHSFKPFNTTFADSSNFTTNSFTRAIDYLYSPSVISAKDAQGVDIDGDGKPDLITGIQQYGSDSLVVYRNNTSGGKISFEPRFNIALMPWDSWNFKAGDLDGDGKPDLVSSTNGNPVVVLKNNSSPGIISFDKSITLQLPGGQSSDISIDDLDGDGRNDIAVASFNSGISIIKNTSVTSLLSFGAPVVYAGSAVALATGDIDGDGKPDIVTTGSIGTSYGPLCLRNTSTSGTISFAAPVSASAPGFSLNGRNISLADLDNDNKLDMIITGDTTYYAIFMNTSTPGNISFAPRIVYKSTGIGYGGVAGNLSGDARPDYMARGTSYNGFSITRNISVPGTLHMENPVVIGPADPYNSHLADFDGDGRMDIVITRDANGASISVFQNTMGIAIPFSLCTGSYTSIDADITGNTYQWQQDTGAGFLNLSDTIHFTGVNSATLYAGNIPASLNNTKYRCIADGYFSSTYAMKVNGLLLPHVSIIASQSPVCYGTPVTFKASGINGGTAPYYRWQLNGITVATGDSIYRSNTMKKNDQLRCILTSSDYCSGFPQDTSNTIIMTVTGSVPSVTIVSDATAVCAGTPISFTASPVNEGSGASYQWQVDGVNTGTNNNMFTSSNLANGQQVKVLMTNNPGCGSPVATPSNGIIISVTPVTTPTVTIGPVNIAGTTACDGLSVTFNSNLYNISNPIYQWQVNAVNQGGNTFYFTPATLKNNDQVKLIVSSSTTCATDNMATSNILTMTIVPTTTSAISITGNTNISPGAQTTISTAVTNGGSTPVYRWQDSTHDHLSWQDIYGYYGPTINYHPFTSGDKIRCILTSSLDCPAEYNVYSNELTFNLTTITAINNVPAASYGIKYFPNPVSAVLYIDSLKLSDQWQTLDITSINGTEKILSQYIYGLTKATVNVSAIPAGYYFAILRRKKGVQVYLKFMKQ